MATQAAEPKRTIRARRLQGADQPHSLMYGMSVQPRSSCHCLNGQDLAVSCSSQAVQAKKEMEMESQLTQRDTEHRLQAISPRDFVVA